MRTQQSHWAMWRRAGKAALLGAFTCADLASAAFTNNILITGYWPPTNEMVRRFSTSTTQNPGGWIGENWEGRGYDIYSYFPEFSGGVGSNPKGNGDFEVDYQDTSADWWRITDEVKPVAIVTFSRGSSGSNWELEDRTANRINWIDDYVAPFRPTPAPPDSSVPGNFIRHSTLPQTQIRDAVNNAGLGINAFVDTSSVSLAGGFLSEFIGYHGMWYQSLHASANDPYQTLAAGHLHVGIDTPLSGARLATDITLRTLITHVDTLVPEPTGVSLLALGAVMMKRCRRGTNLD